MSIPQKPWPSRHRRERHAACSADVRQRKFDRCSREPAGCASWNAVRPDAGHCHDEPRRSVAKLVAGGVDDHAACGPYGHAAARRPAPSARARPTPPCGPGRQADGPCRPSAPFQATCSARRRTSMTAAQSSNERAGIGISSGFLWTAAAGMSRLPGLGGDTTYALAVNDGGDVAGLSTDPAGARHAVRWRASAGWTVEDLGTLFNFFFAVSGSGPVRQHGFLARPDALMTDLAAQGQSAARDLNDFGVVVGGGGSRQGACGPVESALSRRRGAGKVKS